MTGKANTEFDMESAHPKGLFKKFNDSQKRKSVIIFVRPPRPPLKGNRANVENPMSVENDVLTLY